MIEGLFARVFKLIGVELPMPFPRFTYAEVIERFGSDKPDLRIPGMELQDLVGSFASKRLSRLMPRRCLAADR